MKLTLRIYLAVLASLLLFLISILLLGWMLGGHEKREYTQHVATVFETEVLPQLNLDPRYLPRAVVERMHDQHHERSQWDKHSDRDEDHHNRGSERDDRHVSHDDDIDSSRDDIRRVWRENRQLLREFTKRYHASVVILSPQGQPMRRFGRSPRDKGFLFKRVINSNMVAVDLPHDLTAHIRTHNPNIAIESFTVRFLIGLGVLFLCVGLISYPVARRMTKRLGSLTASVNQWGENGSTQLTLPDSVVAGHDEIATLSQSFSRASQRIDELLQANKLLLANASHEIRTPLTRIRLNIEMLEHVVDVNKQDDYQKREAAIKRNLAELDELVESILQSSRIDAQDGLVYATSVDLYTLVKQEAQHYPELILTGGSVQVLGQQNLLTQLIRNLIGNAYKHGKPPVSAHVSVEQDKAILTLTDAGEGIPADKLAEIFTPFKRLSNHTKGNGLGLHLVKKIMELHSGNVSVESEQGNTVFTVRLPVHKC